MTNRSAFEGVFCPSNVVDVSIIQCNRRALMIVISEMLHEFAGVVPDTVAFRFQAAAKKSNPHQLTSPFDATQPHSDTIVSIASSTFDFAAERLASGATMPGP